MELSVGEVLLAGKRQFTEFYAISPRGRNTNIGFTSFLQISQLSTMGEMASALAHELVGPIPYANNVQKPGNQELSDPEDADTDQDIPGRQPKKVPDGQEG